MQTADFIFFYKKHEVFICIEIGDRVVILGDDSPVSSVIIHGDYLCVIQYAHDLISPWGHAGMLLSGNKADPCGLRINVVHRPAVRSVPRVESSRVYLWSV